MTKTAQNWLDTKYPNKTVGGKIELYDKYDKNIEGVEELTGELLIENYVNVEEINLEGRTKGKITKVTINNCPKLKKFKFNNNEVSEVIFESNCPDLERIEGLNNKLTEIDISHLPNLFSMHLPVNNIKGMENVTKLKLINLTGGLGFNGHEYGKPKNSIKEVLNIPLVNPLPDTWETDLKTKLDELKNQPTQEKLDEAVENERKKYEKHIAPDKLEEEAEKKGMTSKEKYDKVVEERDARPEIEKEVWENDYSKRPKQTELDNIQAELDKIKSLLGLDSTDNLPTDWQNQLAKKDDLEAAQNGLKEWTDKFGGKTADQVEKENKELNDWKDKLPGETPETAAKKITDANNWEDKFPNTTPEKARKELDDLKSKPAGTNITPDIQKKIDDYDKVVRQRDNRPNITLDQYNTIEIYIKKKLGKIKWQEEILGANWEAKIEQI